MRLPTSPARQRLCALMLALALPGTAAATDGRAGGQVVVDALLGICVDTLADYRSVLERVEARGGRPSTTLPEDTAPDVPLFAVLSVTDPAEVRFSVTVRRSFRDGDTRLDCAVSSTAAHPDAVRAAMIAVPGFGPPGVTVEHEGERLSSWQLAASTPRDERRVMSRDGAPSGKPDTLLNFTRTVKGN